MNERWKPVGILAGALFVVNLLARLVVRFAAGSDDGKQVTIGLWALIAVAVLVACVLAVLVGPFVSGTTPFSDGVGLVFRQFFYYVAVSAGGTLIGILAVMTVGQDYKSQALKRYAERVNAKPRKVVRR